MYRWGNWVIESYVNCDSAVYMTFFGGSENNCTRTDT